MRDTEPGDSRQGFGEPSDRAGHPDDPSEWRHETAYVNDVKLHYVTLDPNPAAVDHPTGAAPLVVLLHGFPEYWYTWRHLLSPLADAGYRVVAPDLRGYNRSSAPAGVDSYRMGELVADVRGLIGHRGAPAATIVGHDWGGLIGWECALREPDLVSQLVVINAPHPDVYRHRLFRSPAQLCRSWYVFAVQLPWVPERLLAVDGYRLLGDSLSQTAGSGVFTEADIERYRAAMRRSESLSGPLNYYRAIARETVATQLRSFLPGEMLTRRTVERPTLVLWGERDPVLGLELLDGLDEVVTELRLRRLPDTGHWPHLERPNRVVEEMLAFLQ